MVPLQKRSDADADERVIQVDAVVQPGYSHSPSRGEPMRKRRAFETIDDSRLPENIHRFNGWPLMRRKSRNGGRR
jgi:hypothetical protein